MTFRRPPGQKWFYPFILCAIVGLGGALLALMPFVREPESLFAYLFLLTIVLFICIRISMTTFGAKIEVDEVGIRWKDGGTSGELRWEQVAALSHEGISIGLVDRASGRSVPLPFVTRQLYENLSARLNRLKPEEEAILFP